MIWEPSGLKEVRRLHEKPTDDIMDMFDIIKGNFTTPRNKLKNFKNFIFLSLKFPSAQFFIFNLRGEFEHKFIAIT